MDLKRNHPFCLLMESFLIFFLCIRPAYMEQESSVESLLPELESWTLVDSPQVYHPENLFEYINGAAESYISYGFKELIVAEYKVRDNDCDVVLEIYDMGDDKNGFGIYSLERYPDSHFISIGTQGYLEQGTLIFLAGRYYAKLMSFECGDEAGGYLKNFSEKISEKVPGEHQFPSEIELFPKQGLVKNSERFILSNFLGYDFLHSGFTADYHLAGNEFSCFLMAGKDELEAKQMLEKYVDAKKDQEIEETSYGFHIKDRYYENILLARKGKYIFGVLEINDSFEDTGQQYLSEMIENVKE